MSQIINAVFESGMLKPLDPIGGLCEGDHVRLRLEKQDEHVADPEAAFWEFARRNGLLDESTWTTETTSDAFEPIKISGPPMSATILEDRD